MFKFDQVQIFVIQKKKMFVPSLPQMAVIIVKHSVFRYFRFNSKLEEIQGPTRTTAGNFFKSSMKKNILFLDENIPYLEGERGGGPRVLTKKNYPVLLNLFLHSWGPLGIYFLQKLPQCLYMHQGILHFASPLDLRLSVNVSPRVVDTLKQCSRRG